MKKNKVIFVLLVLLIIGLLYVAYISYGFFNTRIFGNDNSKVSKYVNSPISITYSDNTSLVSLEEVESFTPGDSFSKTITVTNSSNKSFNFKMSLEDVINTFTRKQDITYTLSIGNNIIKTNMFPSEDEVIIFSQAIQANESITYTLTIDYLNCPEENQIVDSGAEIGGNISFDYGQNLLIYGNSVQNGAPSPDNPIDNVSVGEYVVHSSLPEGYTELEYIESSGNQYIDTGIYMDGNNSIYVDFQLLETKRDIRVYGADFDSNTGISGFSNSLYQNGQAKFAFSYQDNNGNWVSTAIGTDLLRHTFFLDGVNKTAKMDGGVDSKSVSGYSASNTAVKTLYIFADNRPVNSNMVNYYSKMKLYSFKIWDNDTLIRDYIPAKNSNNIVGLYDKVNNVFYTSPNNNNFIAGNLKYRYNIPVTINNTLYNVYLDEPLRKVGDNVDYIDFAKRKVIRNVKHLELAISNMNAGSYPGWKNNNQTMLFRTYFPSQNGTLRDYTSFTSNIGGDIWTVAINTNDSNNIVFFSNKLDEQEQIMADYPNLVYKLDYAIPTSEEENAIIPDIVLDQNNNNVEVNTTIEPSDIIYD